MSFHFTSVGGGERDLRQVQEVEHRSRKVGFILSVVVEDAPRDTSKRQSRLASGVGPVPTLYLTWRTPTVTAKMHEAELGTHS